MDSDSFSEGQNRNDSNTPLVLDGRLTVADAGRLRDAAVDVSDRSKNVVANCENLEFIDTASLQVLLSLKKTLNAAGLRLLLEKIPFHLENWLSETAIGSLFSSAITRSNKTDHIERVKTAA